MQALFTNEKDKFYAEIKSGDKKYTKVWLSRAETFGIDKVRRYVLNVQAEYEIKSYNSEIKAIVKLLSEKAITELQCIFRIAVHDYEDGHYCQSDEFLVYEA